MIEFHKYHGLGNDFVVIDDLDGRLEEQYSLLARKLCDRHFGIGGDGLILLNRTAQPGSGSIGSIYKMRIFNSDGSEAEMCGNGIRCLGKHIYDQGYISSVSSLVVQTNAGDMKLELQIIDDQVQSITVDMGVPLWDAPKVPVESEKSPALLESFIVAEREFILSCVSMGNPHAVCVLDTGEYGDLELAKWGPLLEKHPRFPVGSNIEFIRVVDEATIDMQVWERGAGPTLACGTGACAVVAVTHRLGLTKNKVQVNLPGGVLDIELSPSGNVFMTGPAMLVFTGHVNLG